MTKAYNQFETNIDNLNSLTIIHEAFASKISALDISNILRSQIVLAVSALDSYIHDICEEAMVYIFFNKNFSNNNSFKNFAISLECLHQIRNASTLIDQQSYLKKEIKKHNSYKSFQEPDKISSALSIIGLKSVWVKIGQELSEQSPDLQKTLSLIVQRRNQIAHESDINPLLGLGEKFNIDDATVATTISFIKKIVSTIDKSYVMKIY
jgi:hypothetical protein